MNMIAVKVSKITVPEPVHIRAPSIYDSGVKKWRQVCRVELRYHNPMFGKELWYGMDVWYLEMLDLTLRASVLFAIARCVDLPRNQVQS